ncbi:MAG: thiol oxidoreductase [Cyclobacteriaceae bacterium]|nr:thiol oxidoreductase [Cyclobacteriaceae bacterium]
MRFWIIIGVLFSVLSCEVFEPTVPADDEILDGPVPGLTAGETIQFQRGDVAFNDEIFTTRNGLGPYFVATSCGSCHPGDGKGHPFTTLTRFGQSDISGNQFLHQGGPQLQHRAIPGFTPEVLPNAPFARFTPPANTGLGYLDAISDAQILAMADPLDADGDGISGVPNWIDLKPYVTTRPNSIPMSGKYIGRFGKKGATYDLLQQTATAYNQDIGINSTFEPIDTYSGDAVDPEISDQTIHDVVFYLKTLKVPTPRVPDHDIELGRTVFENLNCSGCHKPQLQTGTSAISSLSDQPIAPYTDLLLHDMGPGLDDGYTEGSAATYEWRTPPLWGLGLSKNSQGGNYFLLHDGRARSIEEAILMHGGEATASKNAFSALSSQAKDQLIKFLESL